MFTKMSFTASVYKTLRDVLDKYYPREVFSEDELNNPEFVLLQVQTCQLQDVAFISDDVLFSRNIEAIKFLQSINRFAINTGFIRKFFSSLCREEKSEFRDFVASTKLKDIHELMREYTIEEQKEHASWELIEAECF